MHSYLVDFGKDDSGKGDTTCFMRRDMHDLEIVELGKDASIRVLENGSGNLRVRVSQRCERSIPSKKVALDVEARRQQSSGLKFCGEMFLLLFSSNLLTPLNPQ
jgi:hypothetical protein